MGRCVLFEAFGDFRSLGELNKKALLVEECFFVIERVTTSIKPVLTDGRTGKNDDGGGA
jgi:hypothetical protein